MYVEMSNKTKNIDWVISLKCKRCNVYKELWNNNWYKHKQWFLWVISSCRDCIKKWRKTERELEMARKRDSERYYNNEKRRKYMFESANKRRIRKGYSSIHSKTQRKINKLWIRPKNCSLCWIESNRIEAHHFDYEKRNKICFVCSRCHSKLDMWKVKMKECKVVDLEKF